ncbi:SH2 domain-containing protein 4B [Toxocara canis]|uniref:SH2 domain-containing protein 4B n=1 Tax=Toxocara canis TaxID=6265 RepID=A0A0B2W3Q2_TOXCA|nr:SH2 domain-containing protein 4B [Toxocara canis]
MSMLQQILDQMFVDPDILNALDEEQKQILFIKMREEQVKRWKAFEEKCEKEPPPPRKKNKDDSRRIKWLNGSDGEVWVWVMGEHKDDLSLEELIEKRDLEEARKLAEKEMLESIRLTELEDNSRTCLYPNEDESTLKQQLSRMGMPVNNAVVGNKTVQEPTYGDADVTFERAAASAIALPNVTSTLASGGPPDGALRAVTHAIAPNTSPITTPSQNSQTPVEIGPGSTVTDVEPNKGNPPPLPVRPPRLKHALMKEASPAQKAAAAAAAAANDVSKLHITSPKLGGGEISVRSNGPTEMPTPAHVTFLGKPTTVQASVHLNATTNLSPNEPQRTRGVQMTQSQQTYSNISLRDADSMPGSSGMLSFGSDSVQTGNTVPLPQTKTFPFPTAQLPSVSNSLVSCSWEQRSATLPAKIDFSAAPYNVKMRANAGTRPSLTDEDITKRQSEIFEMMKEKHKKIVKEAEIEAERVKFAWEEQERKAREAEAQIRQIAQKAREQHRQQSLRTSTSILPALKDTKASSLREAIRNLPRPPKPKSRQAIVDWFRVEELARGTGLDPKTHMPAPWFHGIISRDQADALLKGRPAGSFLVRVSERIWGYTVSYVVGEGSPKHFLIERIPQGYQFLGTNQVVHEQLYDLITYHETAPITVKGNEILKWPVGQNCSPPDYADLIFETSMLPGGTHANTLPASIYRRF